MDVVAGRTGSQRSQGCLLGLPICHASWKCECILEYVFIREFFGHFLPFTQSILEYIQLLWSSCEVIFKYVQIQMLACAYAWCMHLRNKSSLANPSFLLFCRVRIECKRSEGGMHGRINQQGSAGPCLGGFSSKAGLTWTIILLGA